MEGYFFLLISFFSLANGIGHESDKQELLTRIEAEEFCSRCALKFREFDGDPKKQMMKEERTKKLQELICSTNEFIEARKSNLTEQDLSAFKQHVETMNQYVVGLESRT